MKKILFFAAVLLSITAANAKVWRINYDANANADFRTISAACATTKVADTDTLYCEAGYHAGNAGNNNISRSGMTVVGPGWGFEANYGNTTTICEAKFSNNILIAANNVKLVGIVCDKNIVFGTSVNDSESSTTYSNISIERCKAGYITWRAGYNSGTLSDIVIKNCYLTQIYLYGQFSHAAIHNLCIEGNIINIAHIQYTPAFNLYGQDVQNYTNINILHNTIIGNTSWTDNKYSLIQTVNSLIQDNIIINTANETFVMDFNQTGNVIRKNVFSLSPDNVSTVISEKYPDNYYVGATIANTFVNTTTGGYYDEAMRYQVLETSPARGGAYDGTDCGVFGGASPYVLNGRPQGIPYIYDVEVPAQPKDNKLHVTFKVKGQNE